MTLGISLAFVATKKIAVFLSELRKAGWIEMKMDSKDARKTIYKLKAPEKAIKELIKDLGKNG